MHTPKHPCFYVPGQHSIIDTAVLREDGVWRSTINNEDLEQIRTRYPKAEFGDFDVIYRLAEESFKTEPIEISEPEYIRALEVLPPVGWKAAKGVDSFKMPERFYGVITAIYAHVGDRYFTFNDKITTKAEEIADRVCNSIAFKRKPLRQITYQEFRQMNSHFYQNDKNAEYDFELLASKIKRLNESAGPRVGDFVLMPDDSLRRFTYDWKEAGLQTTLANSTDTSFFLTSSGFCDFSGSLDEPIPADQLEDTLDNRLGCIWFFSWDLAKAHNGVYAKVAFRVYRHNPTPSDR